MTLPAAETVLKLVASEREAALGTIDETGRPYVSGVGYLFRKNETFGAFWVLLSDLAPHARFLRARPRACLLIAESRSGVPIHEKKRVSIFAEPRLEEETMLPGLRSSYRERFPRAGIFIDLPDFRFYRLDPSEAHWVGGFGRAENFRVGPSAERPAA